jgi:hypothetical protein
MVVINLFVVNQVMSFVKTNYQAVARGKISDSVKNDVFNLERLTLFFE